MNYKPLRTEFDGRADQKGFTFKQLKRVKDIALFQKTKENGAKYFEVILVQRHDAYKIGNTIIEASETFSSSSAWGISGWSYKTIKEAEQKFKELTK